MQKTDSQHLVVITDRKKGMLTHREDFQTTGTGRCVNLIHNKTADEVTEVKN